MPELLATFPGPVACRRGEAVPGFTLSGETAERPGEPTTLTFAGTAPADLPETLAAVRVERATAGEYVIAAGTRSWTIAGGVELHREVAPAFYRALPPRPMPWARRLSLRAMLALAATRAGLALLRRLRR